MPINPNIAMGIQIPQIQPVDPLKTYLTLAQIRDMNQQADLRNLQAGQLQRTMTDYAAVSAPGGPLQRLQDLAVGRRTPAPGQGGLMAPPASGALGQQPLSPQSSPLQGPTPGGVTLDQFGQPGFAPGERPSIDRNAGQPPFAPGERERQSLSGLAPPKPGQPEARQASAEDTTPPSAQGDLTPSEQRRQIYQEIVIKYPYARDLVTPMLAIEKQNLEQQHSELKMHGDALGMIAQGMSNVLAQPAPVQPQAYVQTVGMLRHWGVPGVEQLPQQFDPQAVHTLATGAISAQERVNQQQKQMQMQIDAHDADSRRITAEAARTTAGTGQVTAQTGRMEALTKEREAGIKQQAETREGRKVEPFSTAQGMGTRPVYPQPGGPGVTYTPQPGGGGVALPPEYGKTQTLYDAQGNAWVIPENIPPGQTPMARQPLPVPPGYSRPPGAQPMPGAPGPLPPGAPGPLPQGGPGPIPPGAQPMPGGPGPLPPGGPGPLPPGAAPVPPAPVVPGGTGTPLPQGTQGPVLMNQEAVQKNLQVGRSVQQKQLEDRIPSAEGARETLDALDKMKILMHQGYDDSLKASFFAGPEWQKLRAQGGPEAERAARTFEIQNLANRIVIDAQGGRGLRVGPTEIGKLEGSSGRLEQIPPKNTALQTVDNLRSLAKQELQHFNELASATNTQGVAKYPMKPTMSQAEFTQRYQNELKNNPSLTKDDLALRYERANYHVEGAY